MFNITALIMPYRFHGLVLETVTFSKYLGVDISSDLTWRSHVYRIIGSATKTLNFARRNIKTKHPGVREMAYYTLVRPQLEYAAAVWDPHTKGKTSQVEKVQRRTARWVSSNYVWLVSVTDMIQVQSAKYLGITISDDLDWGQHISEISSKATKTLGFLRRNLAFAPRHTKEVAYKTLVRP